MEKDDLIVEALKTEQGKQKLGFSIAEALIKESEKGSILAQAAINSFCKKKIYK